MAWYDTNTSSDFTSKMAEDLNRLQDGIGEKMAMLVFFWSSYLLAHIVAFVYGWELTLVLMAVLPAMAVAGGVLARAQTSLANRETEAYSAAGAFAEEMLAGLRTVIAFGGEAKEVATYRSLLRGARRAGILRGAITGLSGGLSYGICFATYGLAFWVGIRLMTEYNSDICARCEIDDLECLASCARYTPRALLTVFYSVLLGGWNLGQAAPFLEAVNSAKSAAASIFWIIGRQPVIDSSSSDGLVPEQVTGELTFSKVTFTYPARPEVEVLRGLNLGIPAGKMVALVGASGCGKSTCIQLLQRLYDPVHGMVSLDGVDLRELNIHWLRRHVAVVGQEPVLFDLTIRENILLACPDAQEEDIIAALKAANAWNFVKALPARLDTLVGQTGVQLSGGQKQRIAIARALVRKPQILLLDEATSALDTASEAQVQEALDEVTLGRTGRTTVVVVAHRLSTILKADMIAVIEGGQVAELGTHEELMAKGSASIYAGLVLNQLNGRTTNNRNEAEDTIRSVQEAPEHKDSDKDAGMTQHTKHNAEVCHKAEVVEDDSEKSDSGSSMGFGRLLAANRPEWPYILVGVLASVAMGGAMSLFSVLFGAVAAIVSYEDLELAKSESVHYAVMFGLLGIGSTLLMALQGIMFAISGKFEHGYFSLSLLLSTRTIQSLLLQP